MKTSEKMHARNKRVKSTITATRRKLYDAIAHEDKGTYEKTFHEYCSVLDKAVKKGMIKANTANRRKSRIAGKLSAVVQPLAEQP